MGSGLVPSKMEVDEHWQTVSKVEEDGVLKYSNLLKVVNFFRIMSVSNAFVERLHSHTKLIKTPHGNQQKVPLRF